ncbi:hypothetical protein JKP88DRAFT_352738 [Tribonema minus]|uniref:SET domain-containing protein n=1 Tax=Tribonema minus TaxID=303371 RepID=A0A836CL99_9STRA|nr:hypothetical protein JKP88DRAFT_352738 [Tribonema minus]
MSANEVLRAAKALGTRELAFVNWILQPAMLKANPDGLPLLFRGPAGYGLRAPARGCRAADCVLRVPPEVWLPCSGEFAQQQAASRAPAFARRLHALHARVDSPHLAHTAALALALQFAAAAEADPLHTYARLICGGAMGEGVERGSGPPPLPLARASAESLEHLQASPLAQDIRRRAAAYERIHAALFQGSPLESDERARRAFVGNVALLLSRATSGGGMPFALVPYFDMLNHAAAPPSCAQAFEAATGSYTVTALRDHAPGEELLIDYGARAKGVYQMVRTYGFADLRCAAAAAAADPAAEPAAAAAAADLLQVEVAVGGVRTLELPISWDFAQRLPGEHAPPPRDGGGGRSADGNGGARRGGAGSGSSGAVRSIDALLRGLDATARVAAYRSVASQLQSALAKYGTSLEHDLGVLSDGLADGGGGSGDSGSDGGGGGDVIIPWELLCVYIRAAEKRALTAAVRDLDAAAAAASAG